MPTLTNISTWPPQAYGIWGIFLLVASYMLNGWLQSRKLSIEDRQANREGFARQVEFLQRQLRDSDDESRRARTELVDMRERLQQRDREHDEYRKLCQAETDQLRKQILDLEDDAAGMRRQFDQLQATMARRFGITNGNGK